jgi:hypothetical protein
MSYPSNMTKEEREKWTEAMNYPLYKKGDIVDGCTLLEDSTAHGCPMVERDGKKFAKTMYGMEEALRLMNM